MGQAAGISLRGSEPDGWNRDDERDVQETEIRIDTTPNSVHIESDYDRVEASPHAFVPRLV